MLARYHYYRDIRNCAAAVHVLKNIEAAAPRHYNIEQHKRYTGAVLMQHIKALLTSSRGQNAVIAAEY